jgi:hypothetical protein
MDALHGVGNTMFSKIQMIRTINSLFFFVSENLAEECFCEINIPSSNQVKHEN